MTEEPLVSIITPCFNSEVFIEETIRSVLGQSYKNIEYIIIDNESKDTTMNIIKSFESKIITISEEDNNMYQAINKGFRLSKGDIIAYLNSDDIYYKNSIQKVVEEFKINRNIELIYGNLDYIDDSGKKIFSIKYPKFNKKSFQRVNFQKLGQPSTFWKKSLLDKLDSLDEGLKMAGDFDFYLRAASNSNFKLVNHTFAAFRIHKNSMTVSQDQLAMKEIKLLKKRFSYRNNYKNSFFDIYDKIKFQFINFNFLVYRIKKFFNL